MSLRKAATFHPLYLTTGPPDIQAKLTFSGVGLGPFSWGGGEVGLSVGDGQITGGSRKKDKGAKRGGRDGNYRRNFYLFVTQCRQKTRYRTGPTEDKDAPVRSDTQQRYILWMIFLERVDGRESFSLYIEKSVKFAPIYAKCGKIVDNLCITCGR